MSMTASLWVTRVCLAVCAGCLAFNMALLAADFRVGRVWAVAITAFATASTAFNAYIARYNRDADREWRAMHYGGH